MTQLAGAGLTKIKRSVRVTNTRQRSRYCRSEQLTVARLNFSAADGPAQTDERPVSVGARVGFDDLASG